MTRYYLIYCFTFLTLMVSCKSDPCDDVPKSEYERPELSEEYLKWIYTRDSIVFFKYTVYDQGGSIKSLDTVKREYTKSVYSKQFSPKNYNCDDYGTCYEALLILNRRQSNFLTEIRSLTINNSTRKNGFSAYQSLARDEIFNEETLLDTALVNGKLYHDVFKLQNSFNEQIYYSKENGFIYIKLDNTLQELIP